MLSDSQINIFFWIDRHVIFLNLFIELKIKCTQKITGPGRGVEEEGDHSHQNNCKSTIHEGETEA